MRPDDDWPAADAFIEHHAWSKTSSVKSPDVHATHTDCFVHCLSICINTDVYLNNNPKSNEEVISCGNNIHPWGIVIWLPWFLLWIMAHLPLPSSPMSILCIWSNVYLVQAQAVHLLSCSCHYVIVSPTTLFKLLLHYSNCNCCLYGLIFSFLHETSSAIIQPWFLQMFVPL